MEFEKVIKERCSIRKFSDKLVSDDLLNKILIAGNFAPTAKNIQPQKIYVIRSNDYLEKIDMVTPCRYNAKICLLVCSNKDIAYKKDDYSTYEMDAVICATHMMLEATNLEVDNIWIENFDKNKTKELFNLSDGIIPICIINLGYRAIDYTENPMHNVRKELDEIVEYL